MERLKIMMMTFDTFLVGIWGLTIIDLLAMVTYGDFSFVDNSIKTLLAAAGLFYLVFVRIPNEVRNAKLTREIKRHEAKRLKMENEVYDSEHEETKKDEIN